LSPSYYFFQRPAPLENGFCAPGTLSTQA